MTREEAIEILQGAIKKPNTKDGYLGQAIDMAIKALEQEPCEDAISRVSAINAVSKALKRTFVEYEEVAKGIINKVPSINPQPKIGHWIMIDKELQRYKCSECGEVIKLYKKSEISKLEKDETLSDYPFSHCGAKMESEDKECTKAQ